MNNSVAVGIDLGTTRSIIAIAGDEPKPPKGYQVDGVTVILDERKRRTTPSVVVDDPTRPGQVIVGHRAKQRAGLLPAPIMSVKRSMGTDRRFALAGRQCLPEEVSAEILKYLKQLAEQQLGKSITQAVITVPAYFGFKQNAATKRAGEIAGFEVEAILQEPVAAAIAYTRRNPQDPLRIMCYDLSNDFDVAIIEKRQGSFTVLAFDGDLFVGGRDFDKLLADRFLEKLSDQNYSLQLDPNNTEDQVCYTTLLMAAEDVKIALSHELQVDLISYFTNLSS